MSVAREEFSGKADAANEAISKLHDALSAWMDAGGTVASFEASLSHTDSNSQFRSNPYERGNMRRVAREVLTLEVGRLLQMPGGTTYDGQPIRSAPDIETYYTSDRTGEFRKPTLKF
jgi:hypothetical protein